MNIVSAPALGLFVAAAFFEIAGCFAFWAWLRLGKSIWWLAPGTASLAWLWVVERQQPHRWDFIGAAVCILGAAIILFAPRTA